MTEQRILSKGYRTTEDHVFMQINWLNMERVFQSKNGVWTLLICIDSSSVETFCFVFFSGAKIEFRELRKNSVQSIEIYDR